MMPTYTSSNKRIAKNTLLLYARMLFNMAIALYTSRIVLEALGVDEYGIYNVVGGIVSMMSFLNTAMTSASQRFISYEQGTNNLDKQKKVYSASVRTQILLVIIVVVICESIGLWFLNAKMNIDPYRMVAANIVYQCALITFSFAILMVPFTASIIAHEKMGVYAVVTVMDGIIKLIIAYLLLIFNGDKLILYSALLTTIAILNWLVYYLFCRKIFPECRFVKERDTTLFKKMFSFAGWSFIGNFGFAAKDYGVNIVLNLFFGTAVNAARGVALQVSNALMGVVSNFQLAMNPQITKCYATGDVEPMKSLIRRGSRFSFYLISLVAIPLLLRTEYLLGLWLVDVPKYTSEFLKLSLVMGVVNSMFGPMVTGMQATGNIKVFQIVIAAIMLCDLPLAYLLLNLGFEPYIVVYVAIGTAFVGLVARLFLLDKEIHIGFSNFFIHIICKNILLFVAMILPLFMLNKIFNETFISLIIITLISALWIALIVFVLGLEKGEKLMVISKIKHYVKHGKR